VRLNPSVIVSDVEGFISALARARAARGRERVAAAEEALTRRVSSLVVDVPRERILVARKIEMYRWLDLDHWERAAGRLEALGRAAALLLGRAYREAGCCDRAMVVYGQLLCEVPHDQRVQEGLLLAAAGTGDAAQLSQVWQQVLASVDGDPDIECARCSSAYRARFGGEGYQRRVLQARGNGCDYWPDRKASPIASPSMSSVALRRPKDPLRCGHATISQLVACWATKHGRGYQPGPASDTWAARRWEEQGTVHPGPRMAAALRRSSVRCEGISLGFADGVAAGQEVPHMHLHVRPRFAGDARRP
jgi:hypothetical protein